jgi:hypothetical protein
MLLHNAIWIAEQPSSSLFELHTRWLQLTHTMQDDITKLFLWLQGYGGTSPKATLLYQCGSTNMIWSGACPFGWWGGWGIADVVSGESPCVWFWYSNSEAISELWRPLDKNAETMVKTSKGYFDSKGVFRVQGCHPELKSTQAYPKDFGVAAAGAWQATIRKRPMGDGIATSALASLECDEIDWPDADLQQVLVDMGVL